MSLDNYRGYGDFDLCDPRTVTSYNCTSGPSLYSGLVRPVRP